MAEPHQFQHFLDSPRARAVQLRRPKATFCATVRWEQRVVLNIMPTRRDSGATCMSGVEMTVPSSRMRPARSGSKPAMARSTVVLPQPDSPSRQPMWPAGSDSVRSRTTSRTPLGVS